MKLALSLVILRKTKQKGDKLVVKISIFVIITVFLPVITRAISIEGMAKPRKSEVTQLLQRVQEGSEKAYNQLFPLIYEELKKLAFSKLKKEHSDITISKTELVHEVYIKMINQDAVEFENRNHFLAIASRCMRQILIDHARKRKAKKRGGEKKDVTYIDEILKVQEEAAKLVDIDQKIEELSELNERLAKIVEMRFFGEMTMSAIADVLDISERTVKRDWAKARGWLYKELKM